MFAESPARAMRQQQKQAHGSEDEADAEVGFTRGSGALGRAARQREQEKKDRERGEEQADEVGDGGQRERYGFFSFIS